MYWLGVNDKKASIFVSRLKELGLAYEDGGRIYLTDRGKDLCRYALQILGFYDINIVNLDQVLKTVRERHVCYRARTVSVSLHRVFDEALAPTPKVKLFIELWRKLTTFQRISAAVFMAMDFERVEDQIKDLRKKALRAELSGVHRYVRLFSLALPPNLLGQEIPLKELAIDIGFRWKFAEVLRDRSSLARYVAQVDALRLARYVPENDALSPLHETGLKAFKWLAERVDSAFRNIIDFYQPIAVSLYAIIYNNLITYDELIEGTRPRELERSERNRRYFYV